MNEWGISYSVTEEDVVRRNCLAKSCPYCVRNSLLEDQNHSIVTILKYVIFTKFLLISYKLKFPDPCLYTRNKYNSIVILL